MNPRTIILALCCLLIGVLGTLALNRAGQGDHADAQALQALAQRLDRIESRQTAQPAQGTRASALPDGDALGQFSHHASAQSPSDNQPDALSGPEAAIRLAQRAAELEGRFSAEKRVPAWAATAEKQRANSAESELLVQANLVPEAFQTVCKSSRCRVRASFSSASAAQEWANLYVMDTAGTLSQAQIVQKPLPGGRSELTIYGTR